MMGAEITSANSEQTLPIKIRGKRLKGIRYSLPMASAQVKSCLLLAGLYAEGVSEITEPVASRDHTERFLRAFGADYSKEGDIHRVHETRELKAASFEIPGDISSAAFFIVGALISGNSQIVIKDVGLNMARIGLLNVLKRMRADISISQVGNGPEPKGDVAVSSSRLRGVVIDKEEVPSLIDEIPILALAASLAEGETVIRGAGELRVKESDRISGMVKDLNSVGAKAEELPDGLRIQGVERLKGGSVASFGDHRIAMTFAVAALASRGDILLDDLKCIDTSYPQFFSDFEKLRQ
jgi:3-phosphoshikimate 1-carboxyvinyltransferase